MKTMNNSLTLVVAMVVSTTASAARAEEMSCRAIENGIEHVAKVEITAGKVAKFFYGSMSKNGNTCEVAGNRAAGRTTWGDDSDGSMTVTIPLSSQKQAHVALRQKKDGISIQILSPLTDVCGVGGFISDEVLIPRHGNKCRVVNADHSKAATNSNSSDNAAPVSVPAI